MAAKCHTFVSLCDVNLRNQDYYVYDYMCTTDTSPNFELKYAAVSSLKFGVIIRQLKSRARHYKNKTVEADATKLVNLFSTPC